MQVAHTRLRFQTPRIEAVYAPRLPALHRRSAEASSLLSRSGNCRWPLHRSDTARSLLPIAECMPLRLAFVTTQEYRRNVGICLVNASGLVFTARRVDDKYGTWQMPQGGIDQMENPFVAAARELLEETGIRSIKFVAQIDSWIDYEFPTTVKSALTGCLTQYKGQTQKWMLFRFCGDESEINLDFDDKEFLEYKWAELHDLPHKVVHFKQHVYQHVVLEFGPYIDKIKAEKA